MGARIAGGSLLAALGLVVLTGCGGAAPVAAAPAGSDAAGSGSGVETSPDAANCEKLITVAEVEQDTGIVVDKILMPAKDVCEFGVTDSSASLRVGTGEAGTFGVYDTGDEEPVDGLGDEAQFAARDAGGRLEVAYGDDLVVVTLEPSLSDPAKPVVSGDVQAALTAVAQRVSARL